MTLLDKIRVDAISARKARDPKSGVLVTLIGEADTEMKKMSAPRPLEDGEVVAIVRKFLKNIDETLDLTKAPDAIAKARAERAALEIYLPTQMTADELTSFARAAAAEGANLGQIMGRLRAEKAGQYDGKLASSLVKLALG
ncbi:GatB/YqeY domain-containing protein [Paracoccus litorisediminis]|uniref:GatB/YqeY domain-containing protein n=1 Tax=Paracoccus litorisediminis TaxID=2006130 RepID=UPI00373026CD